MLTTSELKQVKHYLELYSKKDSQLPAVPVDLEHPEGIFTAEDYLAIVQDADNKIITIKNLEKVFLLTFLTDEDFREALKGKIPEEMLENACVTTEKLADGAVTTIKLGNSAVTTAKIATGAITGDKIANDTIQGAAFAINSITSDKIVDGAITNQKITDSAVTTDKIANSGVTTTNINNGAVTTAKIADGNVTTDKINNSAVSEGKLAAGAVNTSKISDNAVTTDKLANGAVTEGKINSSAVTADKIVNGAITESKLATGAVTTIKIVDANVTTVKIADGAVTTAKINNGAVTTDKIPNNNITTTKINDGAVTSDKIPDNAIITSKIADANVTTTKIANGAVTEDKLADGAITTDKLADGLISEIQNITDATPTTGSIKPVQSGGTKTAIDNLNNNKANKDGYYSQMTVGSAENLVGQTIGSEAYLVRPTGGESNEAANGVASVLGMEGNSCVWNQLIKNGDFSDSINNWSVVQPSCSFTVNNSIAEITKTSSGLGGTISSSSVKANNTHKYYICSTLKTTASAISIGFFEVDGTEGGNTILSTTSTEFTKLRGIVTPKLNSHKISIRVGVASTPNGTKGYVKNVVCVDLTLLGIDNLTTVAQVEAWLAEHVGLKPYYAYNSGTILSAQTLGIKTYGQNLLNPTTKQAKLIPYTWVENGTTYSNQYTIKNIPSGATATFTPDATGIAESITITDNEFDITTYGSGILELSAATADTYVCMKWNGDKDNDVVPYEDHTQEFDVRKVYGKVNGAGEYVQCFPNGMKSAGSIHDTLTASKAVVKIEKFVFPASASFVQAAFASYAKPSNMRVDLYRNYLLTIGLKRVESGIASSLFSFSENETTININIDGVGSHVAAAMNGQVMFYYLKSPITYTDLIYRDGGIDRPLADVLINIEVNNWSMEEQLMTPYVDGNPTSIPATIKTQYGMDAVEAIDTLQKTCYFADDVKANLQALLTCINTNCVETLGGTFSISETATDKVFEFTFTPNE